MNLRIDPAICGPPVARRNRIHHCPAPAGTEPLPRNLYSYSNDRTTNPVRVDSRSLDSALRTMYASTMRVRGQPFPQTCLHHDHRFRSLESETARLPARRSRAARTRGKPRQDAPQDRSSARGRRADSRRHSRRAAQSTSASRDKLPKRPAAPPKIGLKGSTPRPRRTSHRIGRFDAPPHLIRRRREKPLQCAAC